MASVLTIRSRIIVFLLVAACLVAAQSQCDCTHGTSGHHYSKADVTNAFDEAKKHQSNTVGKSREQKGKFPHYFGNAELLAFPTGCKKPDLLEFPILHDHTLFSNTSDQGADRVVYNKKGDFCGCMTHTGAATPNGFVLCK
ncbi:hypothetical protein PC9H_003130 [Pleurotus ostreatus]|uniref:Uncharacterized protein n=1 Tax=Pleurotus ostreatus TaxID=5322 RepID=A0A8H7A1S2_PLEOS|nr:uncharacterized protein PC9H_003130 [Pleurotus ostreatus]KAF7436301.1 hypothetical protein PC9H_003130 [Pleurotus ostreatus]KAJ8701968.1 hypothetical protein PTI98_000718 [Pleurotus ostreatus]KAJ8701969.1 hypothetical protein PTI98_000718 [Pleurotus ostreatus]